MSPSHVLEPTYASIKRRLMNGSWPAGQRLDSTRLAEELGVSVTPVRDSLSQLVGERMVERGPTGGFFVPRLSEQDLKGLFAFSFFLLHLALIHADRPVITPRNTASDIPSRTVAAFEALANRSANREVTMAVVSLNDRLHRARQLDPLIFADIEAELRAIEVHLHDQPSASDSLIKSLARHHQRRINEAARYQRLLDHGL